MSFIAVVPLQSLFLACSSFSASGRWCLMFVIAAYVWHFVDIFIVSVHM